MMIIRKTNVHNERKNRRNEKKSRNDAYLINYMYNNLTSTIYQIHILLRCYYPLNFN